MSDGRCRGEGQVEVGTARDEFGNWDTETYACPGCPDCEDRRYLRCDRCGDGTALPVVHTPEGERCAGCGRPMREVDAADPLVAVHQALLDAVLAPPLAGRTALVTAWDLRRLSVEALPAPPSRLARAAMLGMPRG